MSQHRSSFKMFSSERERGSLIYSSSKRSLCDAGMNKVCPSKWDVVQVEPCWRKSFPRWFLFYPSWSKSSQGNKDLSSPHWSLRSQTIPVVTGAETWDSAATRNQHNQSINQSQSISGIIINNNNNNKNLHFSSIQKPTQWLSHHLNLLHYLRNASIRAV